eukprot:CAMPEP_0115833676 /NCGR_PEP_ID=MMETSP0287-20121206/3294_1 /TAXON_ID=412157 /ORGANISM="Chrysochromulina rotalis, Strain UIO044" /LENGTH=242 /DNA_ID=CAMNT_0003287095 /DNA_START=31 /DNA_END=760 /DNA_ORIENTATION=-
MKLKVHELRNKSKADLEKQLEELKTELAALRVAKVTGGAASKLSKMCASCLSAPKMPHERLVAPSGPLWPVTALRLVWPAFSAVVDLLGTMTTGWMRHAHSMDQGRRLDRHSPTASAEPCAAAGHGCRMWLMVLAGCGAKMRMFLLSSSPPLLTRDGVPCDFCDSQQGGAEVDCAVLTVINQTQKGQLRVFYKDKDLVPLDLRFKKTRAIRKGLTKQQKDLKTLKQMKKEKHFPLRKYAVKA